jgi:hypothetical protein
MEKSPIEKKDRFDLLRNADWNSIKPAIFGSITAVSFLPRWTIELRSIMQPQWTNVIISSLIAKGTVIIAKNREV